MFLYINVQYLIRVRGRDEGIGLRHRHAFGGSPSRETRSLSLKHDIIYTIYDSGEHEGVHVSDDPSHCLYFHK